MFQLQVFETKQNRLLTSTDVCTGGESGVSLAASPIKHGHHFVPSRQSGLPRLIELMIYGEL
jgi:hypothetical protein